MRRGGRGVAAAVQAAALAAGCTSEDDPPAPADTTGAEVVTDHELDNPEFTPGDEASPEPIPAEDVAVRALSTAADELGGLAFELERTEDGGEALWEVSVAVGDDDVEMLLSRDGNAIVRQSGSDALDDEDRRRLEEASVAAGEAALTAAQHTGAAVVEVDLTDDGGAVVWEVELRTTDGASTEVRVDAVTGEVR